MSRPSETEVEHERFWLPLVVTGTAIFVFGVDAGLLSVALPEIERTFPETSRATISWVGTGYSVAGVSLLLVAGRLGDRYGRRRVFRSGMVIFAAGSLVAGWSPTVPVLLAGRVLAGAGGALYTATGLAIALREISAARWAAAVGFWGFVGSLGFIVGPTGGALVVELAGWRTAFALLGPLAVAAAVAAGRVLHESADPDEAREIRIGEAVTGAVAIALVAVGLSQSGRWGWSDGRVAALLGAGLLLLTGLVRRSDRPGALIDRRVWGEPRFAIATAGAGVQQLGFLPWFVALGFVLRSVWGWTVVETGSGLSLGMIVGGVAGLTAGRLADRAGYVGVTSAGAIVAALGCTWWIVRLEVSPDFWGTYLPGLVVFMLGAGVAGILPTGAALHGIPQALLGTANATHSTVRRLAASIGLALMAALLGEGDEQALLDGARAVFAMVAVAHLALVPFMLWYRHVVSRRERHLADVHQ